MTLEHRLTQRIGTGFMLSLYHVSLGLDFVQIELAACLCISPVEPTAPKPDIISHLEHAPAAFDCLGHTDLFHLPMKGKPYPLSTSLITVHHHLSFHGMMHQFFVAIRDGKPFA